MIEIIYSEDTNEKEEKCTDIRLPRNVRQIGKGNENKKKHSRLQLRLPEIPRYCRIIQPPHLSSHPPHIGFPCSCRRA